MEGLVDADNIDILNFDGNLLAASALPEKLQNLVASARVGDMYVYAGPDSLFYTLVVESVYEPKAKPYPEVRQEVGKDHLRAENQ